MNISQIHDTLYNFFLETKLAEKGFVNAKNKELKYDLLYPAGVVLTVENKEFDTAWRADIEKLKKAEPNKKSSTYEWAKDKIKNIDIKGCGEDDINFLIECKYIFEAINDYDRIRRSDVFDALWGSVYSLIDACVVKKLYPAIAMRYKEKLEKYRPFNEFEDFDKKVVLVWQNFLYSITEINYRESYGTDYRNTARYLPEKIKSDITKAITFIGNTNEHRIKCEAAIQGAMISMIENMPVTTEQEKNDQKKALRLLGKIVENKPNPDVSHFSSNSVLEIPPSIRFPHNKFALLNFWKMYEPNLNEYNSNVIAKDNCDNYPNTYWATMTNKKLNKNWYFIGTDKDNKISKLFHIEAGKFKIQQFGINKNEPRRKEAEPDLREKFEVCLDNDNYIDQIKKEADFSDCLCAIADFNKGGIEWFNKDN